ncbi:desmocollin 2-like protein [Anarrhichthys ocellatus]|uniref:desmocollin 2-like protein n=1 Tax=Anarrhichthys ocellatus TaxID=433405 RepID=UPI0012EEC59E|nr:desmocollin-2-like [Anarrhichthys ocellatus]
MANVLLFNLCSLLILSRVESCLIPTSLYIVVPNALLPGSQITTVEVSDCDTDSMRLTSSDPSFTVSSSGVIETVTSVSVAAAGRTFSVRAQDNSGPDSEMFVHLVHSTASKRQEPTGFLKRFKRRWSPHPFNILENNPGPYPRAIDMIVSDSDLQHRLYYTISGPGVDQHPVGVFSLNRTGMLFVRKTVDREEFPKFILTVRAFDKITNVETDKPLDIIIDVDDVNDNAPTFLDPMQFTVLEQSTAGTVVGKVNTTDRDQEKTLHVKIRYSLKTGLDLFAINPDTGVISTATKTLDRETKDKHVVTVEIRDMYGAVTGLSSTATATIAVGDINDNPPTFTKTSLVATVKENENEKLILRIPVEDKDLKPTPNWVSKFFITKGNEKGHFRIETDPKTNEGLLYVSKPLDHELNKNVNLEIMARNEADLVGTTAKWLSIPVDVTVLDEDEGPAFSAPTVRFNVKENTPNGTVIGSYIALDPETKSSNGIKYYKVTDPASWINVDKDSGQLTVANTIDRESQFVHDGLYNITMRAVDASSKTGTGTVIIVVEDVNDNIPTLPPSELVSCEKEGELGSVLVVAEDNDRSPFSSPFSFSLPTDHDGKWSVTRFNDTAATLQQMKELPTGKHNVLLDVKDLQGSGKTQTATVRICRCRNGDCIIKPTSVSFGPMGLLAMLLPLLLLLLLALLVGLFCTTAKEHLKFDDGGDGGGILLKSNTEAPGEEVDSSLIIVPTTGSVVKGSVKGFQSNQDWMINNGSATLGTKTTHANGMYSDVVTSNFGQYNSGRYNHYGNQSVGGNYIGSVEGFDNRHLAQDATLHHNWQTNGRYLNQKMIYFGTEDDGRYADDVLRPYRFEGVGSAAGSVGCCSDIGDDENLDFLNKLGPKFKTLGDVCRKT